MGSEDFSYMLQERQGAYIWLGAGEDSENLHSVHYNFNDKLLLLELIIGLLFQRLY